MYGIMTKISSVSSENQLLMLKNAPEFTKIMIGEICTSFITKCREILFLSIHRLVKLQDDVWTKKNYLHLVINQYKFLLS